MSTPPISRGLPLSGVRVLDMTVVWAGPYSAMLLADLGAEVIRIESVTFWNPVARGTLARPSQQHLDRLGPAKGGFADGVPGARPWNRQGNFNSHARNKLSMTCDLRTPEGLDIVRRLVAVSDGLIENNGYGVIEKLGLGYEALSQINPGFILVSSNGMGHTGPYAHYRGVGTQFEDVLGHTWVRSYPDADPSILSGSVVSDTAAGAGIAFALMAALHHKRRTGEGQYVDMSQAENLIPLMAAPFLEAAITGELPRQWGNRNPEAAPQGVYPAAGTDRWVALTVATTAQFQTLCRILDRQDLAEDPALQTLAGRHARHDELDEIIAAWTMSRDQHAIFHLLQNAGIAAGPVQDEAQIFRDPHLEARGFYVPVTTEDTGERYYHRPLWQMSRAQGSIRRGPVALGADNEYVYKEILTVSPDEWDFLVARGDIGTEPDQAIP